MSSHILRLVLTSLCTLMPAAAMAHPGGEAHSFLAGALHPLGGLDHLAAMLAVGLLAGRYGGAMRLWLPACFVMAMAAGAALGAGSVAQPFSEVGVALSLIAFGLALLSKPSLRVTTLIISTAAFALVHGYAHGTEMGGDVSAVPFVSGLILVTATLHAMGVVLMIARFTAVARLTLLQWSGRAISLLGIISLGTLLQS